jgi:hypothetical protein
MTDDVQTVQYALPLTVVKIEGTVTVSTAASGEKVPVRTSQVSVATEADLDATRVLELRGNWWKEREFDLKLAPDGRLTGAGDSSTGFGAQVVATGLRVAALAARVVPAFLARAPEDVAKRVPVEELLEQEKPELARRRKACAKAVDELQSRIISLAPELARQDGAPQRLETLKAVEVALAAVRAEATTLESEFAAWRAQRFPDWTTNYTYTVGVDRLPNRPTAAEQITLTDGELGEGPVGEVMRTLGVAAVLIGDEDPTQHSDTFEDSGVRYRLPRRCELAVYEAPPGQGEDGQSPELELRKLTPVWIVDAQSEVGFVPFRSEAFEKNGAAAEFGETGTLSHLTNKHTGVAGAVTSALDSAGGGVVESLEQAEKIRTAFSAPDPALKALQDQVARKELEAKLATAMKTIAGAAGSTK